MIFAYSSAEYCETMPLIPEVLHPVLLRSGL